MTTRLRTSADLLNLGSQTHLVELSLQNGRLLQVPRLVHFVDLFCACILNQSLGRQASEMPIKICPQCRMFFADKRREFCSKDCQWTHYWTPERRSDDKWIKDLEQYSKRCEPKHGRSVVDLRTRLELPKVRERLKSIKDKIDNEKWAGWTKISDRIHAIEKLAAK